MQNALRGVTGSSGGGEKGKTRRREGERERDREDSRKRKRSTLDEIRDVRYWSSWLYTVLLYMCVVYNHVCLLYVNWVIYYMCIILYLCMLCVSLQ